MLAVAGLLILAAQLNRNSYTCRTAKTLSSKNCGMANCITDLEVENSYSVYAFLTSWEHNCIQNSYIVIAATIT